MNGWGRSPTTTTPRDRWRTSRLVQPSQHRQTWSTSKTARSFGSSPDDDAASHSVNLVFESESADRYYVELPRPTYIGIDDLRSVMPLGAASVIYLQPNHDPRAENYFNVREGPTWFFTTPQGWILDGPDRGIVTPLDGPDSLGFDQPPGGDTNLAVWLVDPKEPDA